MSKPISQRSYARLAGLLYLIVIIGGGFAEGLVRQRLFVPGDAAATAANIGANEQLMRLAFAADVVPILCAVIIGAILYNILKLVNRLWALAAAFFWLVHLAVQAAAMPFHIAALVVLGGSPVFSSFDAEQIQSLSYLFMRLHNYTYTTALLFFGAAALTVGVLLIRSKFFPSFIGVLMCVAGLCYLANSTLYFVAPGLSSILLLLPTLLGEGAFTLWLLLVGLNEPAWRREAGLED